MKELTSKEVIDCLTTGAALLERGLHVPTNLLTEAADRIKQLEAQLQAASTQGAQVASAQCSGCFNDACDRRSLSPYQGCGVYMPILRRPAAVGAPEWQPIETAPKDGTHVLVYREDCGALLAMYSAPINFCADTELEKLDEESSETPDWFCVGCYDGARLDGSETPTHWMNLPAAPAGSGTP